MKRLDVVSGIFLVLGVIFFLISSLQGNLKVGVFLIFPFVIGSDFYSILGLLFLILAFFLFILRFSPKTSLSESKVSSQDNRGQKPTMKGGGIVLLGPIPIIVGTSWKITLALILAALVLILAVFFLFYFS
jgi:uncharacterized protein (TIGR00304 family)